MPEFYGDVLPLLAMATSYAPNDAFALVRRRLIERLPRETVAHAQGAGVVSRPRIDLQKLRKRLRLQKDHTICAMLDEALETLPPAKLERLVSRYLSIDELGLRRPVPSAELGEGRAGSVVGCARGGSAPQNETRLHPRPLRR